MNKRMSGALKCAMVVWIATLWMGCAFGWALREGDAYAARGQWQQALDAYERALALDPDSRAAQALVEQARRALALDALEQAREAKAAERWSEAVMVLRNAQKLDPTNVEVMALLNDTRDLMLDQSAQLRAQSDHVQAYALAVKARTLFPEASEPDVTLAAQRQTLAEEAEVAASSENYDEALELLGLIPRFEPNRKASIADQHDRIAMRWVAALRADAAQDRQAGHLGPAFVRTAMAAHLSGAAADITAREQLRQLLLDQGGFSVALVDVHTTPPARTTRSDAVQAMVVHQLAQRPGILLQPESGALWLAELTLDSGRCNESVQPEPRDHRYVSGTQQVTHSVWVQRDGALHRVEHDMTAHEQEELELMEAVQELERRAARLVDGPMEQRRRDVQREERKVDSAQADVDKAYDRLQRAEQRLDQVRRNNDTNAEQSARRQVRSRRDALEREQRDLANARAALDRARSRLNTERQSRRRIERDITHTRRDLLELRQAILALRARARDLRRARDRVPPTVPQDVYSTFTYTVDRWTRTCTTPATLQLSKRTPSKPESTVLKASASTLDQAHAAYPKFSIQADPKRYPQSDAQLIRQTDAALVAQMMRLLEQRAEEHHAQLVAEAASAAQPEATRLYVTALLLNPAAHRQRIADHMAAYGVHQLDLLTASEP